MHLAFALPEPAQTGSGGGAAYLRGLVAALHDLGHTTSILVGADPAFPPGALPVIDGMLLPTLQPRLGELADAVAVVHHVSAAAGQDEGARHRVREIEAAMLPRLRRVVATSQPVSDRLARDFAVQAVAVPPGAPDLPRTDPNQPSPHLLAVGVFTRRKRHDDLLRHAARLVDLPWHLTIAGDTGREPAHEAELDALVDELGLRQRVTLLRDPDPAALDQIWSRTTIFTLASRWEGYPSAAAEALRRGIPAIVTDAGDPSGLVPPTAGAAVPLSDDATFGKCLRRLLCDDDLRRDMAQSAWIAGQALPTWQTQARRFIEEIER